MECGACFAIRIYNECVFSSHSFNHVANDQICVATTHLFWHPDHEPVRVVQTHILLEEIKKLNPKKVPTIITGDFNSIPTSGPYHYLKTGHIPHTHSGLFYDHSALIWVA